MVSAGVIYARAGALDDAHRVMRHLERASREAPTAWNQRSVLTLQAEIAFAAGASKQAVDVFGAAGNAYPQASDHVGLALVYERQRDWQHAAEQWQGVLSASGEILQEEFPADLVLAHLQLARVQLKLGDAAGARNQYEKFLKLWHQGDNLHQRGEAVAELRALIQRSEKQGMPHGTEN